MRLSIGLSFAVALLGCGGTAPPPAAEPKPEPVAPAPSDPEPAEAQDAGPDADLSPEDRAVLKEREANFIAICNQSGNNGEYCSCTWDQMRQIVSRDEILADRASPEQVKELQRRALLHCVADIPEETVKKAFLGGCMAKANEAFCTCAYRELRARVSTRDIATRGGEDREGFVAKRTEAVQACLVDVDEATIKVNFIRGCRESGGSQARCDCAWNYVISQATPIDIALDRIDMEKIGPGLRKRCAQSP